ncbi:MAG: hypothetical protein HUK08_03610 [Bacteroidaceae bacterium]|nr:hypothetical protein [Bacteroidaceae bacterium]
MNQNKPLSAKFLTKSNVWKLSENDVVTIMENASKDIDIDTQLSRLINHIKCAFEIEELAPEDTIQSASLEKRGFKISEITVSPTLTYHWAIKKRSISRITDITYLNVKHISAPKILSLIENNFGGGWDSLSQSVKDVILSSFLIANTSVPESRKVEDSAIYKKKIADGFDVLQVKKGTWIELIFAKSKLDDIDEDDEDDVEDSAPAHNRLSILPADDLDEEKEDGENDDEYGEYGRPEEEENEDYEDEYNEDELTEESYRTVVDEEPEDIDVSNIEEEEEEY